MAKSMELGSLIDYILSNCENWDNNNIIPKVKEIGLIVEKQINEKYMSDDKYRVDRNEILSFFEQIKKSEELGIPFSLEHFKQITIMTKKRIRPYPHYSGIKVEIEENLL